MARIAMVTAVATICVILLVASVRVAKAASASPESEDQLAGDVNDPVARLTQIPIKDIFTPAQYGTNAQPNTLKLQPVFAVQPHLFTPLEQLVRPTIQIVTVPRNKSASTTTALDDFQLLDLFVIPFPNERETHFRWGVGPYFIFPTSTSQYTGNGAWQLGPAWAFSWQIQRFKFSWLFQQSSSFAYTSSRSKSVASLQIQPLLTYTLGNGWYLKSSDANWKINLRHKSSTIIPLSAGFGKVIDLARGYALNAGISGEWMAYRQFESQTEQFSLNFQLSILLPDTSL